MSETTTKLGLTLPGGGSTGLILPDEIADIDVINQDLRLLEAATGLTPVTTTTRPGSPYLGQQIIETDTGKGFYWNGLTWVQIIDINLLNNFTGTTAARDAYWGAPGTGTTDQEIAARVALSKKLPKWNNSEKGWEEQYFAKTGDANAFPGLVAKTPGWYPSGSGMVPRIALKAGTTSFGVGVSVITNQANFMSLAEVPLGFDTPKFDGTAPGVRMVIPAGLEGVYSLDAHIRFGTAGQGHLVVKQNNVAADMNGVIAADSGDGVNSINYRSINREITLSAADFLIFAWYQAVAATASDIFWSLTWKKPRTA